MLWVLAGGALLAAIVVAGGAASGAWGPGSGAREVPAVRGNWTNTAAGKRRFVEAVLAAYRAAGLSGESGILATTHSCFATGLWMTGGPKVFNNNIGVIRSTRGWDGPFARMSTYEVVDGRRVLQRGQAFRAYPDLAASAADAVRLWQTARYRAAWDLLLAGDPAWSGALGRAGYYTADPAVFEAGYRNRLARVRRILAGEDA